MANDACNEAMDSAAYALMPIVMTDPNSNPRVGSMILSLAAIWETSPKDTQFAQFPPLWKEGLEIVTGCKNQIKESLAVNSSMVTQQGTSKLNQAEIANEQQVEILLLAHAARSLGAQHGRVAKLGELGLHALSHDGEDRILELGHDQPD
jgi:hypothetical protein